MIAYSFIYNWLTDILTDWLTHDGMFFTADEESSFRSDLILIALQLLNHLATKVRKKHGKYCLWSKLEYISRKEFSPTHFSFFFLFPTLVFSFFFSFQLLFSPFFDYFVLKWSLSFLSLSILISLFATFHLSFLSLNIPTYRTSNLTVTPHQTPHTHKTILLNLSPVFYYSD